LCYNINIVVDPTLPVVLAPETKFHKCKEFSYVRPLLYSPPPCQAQFSGIADHQPDAFYFLILFM
jgi:hypothetical protein